MPTAQDLDRQVRRRPVGRTIYDICSDLAVVPGFCHSAFWNQLHEMMHFLGGSITRLMQEKTARREAFIKQQDRIIGSNWDWVNLSRDAIRQVLGFFIGEPPVNPFDPGAAPGHRPALTHRKKHPSPAPCAGEQAAGLTLPRTGVRPTAGPAAAHAYFTTIAPQTNDPGTTQLGCVGAL